MAGAANWWDTDAHAPSITGVIPAAKPKPSEILRDKRTTQEIENNPLDVEVKRQSLKKSRTDQALSMAQDYNSNPDVKAYNSILPTYAAALQSPETPAGDQGLVYAMAKVMQADGSAVRSEEVQNTESLQPYIDQIKAQYGKQMNGDGTFLPTARKQIREAMAQKMAFLNRAYINQRVRYKEQADRAGLDPRDVVGDHTGIGFQETEAKFLGHPVSQADYRGNVIPNGPQTPPNSPAGGPPDETGKYAGADIRMHMDSPENAQGYRFTPTQETALHEYLTGGNATPEGYGRMMTAFAAAQGVNVDDAYTQSATAQGQKLIEAAKAGKLGDGMSYNQSDKDYRDSLLKEANAGQARETSELLTSGALAGGLDEARGIVGGASSLIKGNGFEKGYVHDRDLTRAVRDNAYEKRPIISGATEMLGALATPGGVSSEVMRGGTLAERIAAGAKAGGRQGIAAGYGYGEGAGDSIKGAVIGGATGALIGGGLPIGGKGISSVYGRFAGKSDQAITDALPVIAAGQAEKVPVSRAMIDPYIQNKVTATQATTLGGPVIDRGLKKTSDAIRTGVDALGRDGTAFAEPSVAGQVVRNAAERYIKTSGAVARRAYDKAERLAGDIKVPAQEMGQEIGSIISRLSETPGTNAGEINFLKTIESDLGKNLSIGALRRMRTQLRQRIAKGELSFGEDEARVLGIMDAAGRDITNGLTAAGKADAAKAFQTADTAYRQRMDFIKGTVQKLIGRRNDTVTPEATFARFKAMASPKGGEENLGRMIDQMEPEEAADIAATLASELGRNNKKNFTTAQLVTQVESLSPAARVHIFGKDGAESLSNLVTLAKAHDDIYSKLNHSRSGVATVGNLYRSAIATAFGVGTTMGTNTGAGLAATAATMGALGARDILSARALMSTRLTRWAKTMPATQEAIQSHIARLSTIAAREPAISGDVISLQNYLASKFSETPLASAAAPGQGRNDRRPPPENNGQ